MIKKILIKKEKREYIEDLKKSVVVSEGKKYFIEDITKDFHCSEGIILKTELQKENTIIKSNKDKEFYIFNASFMDSYKGIKKLAQTIPLKDLGFILAETGVDKNSIVVDTGSGSGGSACFFAKHVKKVHTFDINELNLAQVKRNMEYFDLKNIVIKKANSYEKIPVKNADLVILDLPEPWRAIDSASNCLKVGGIIVAYCPQITQAQMFINELMRKENYIQIKSVEIVERDWKIEGQIVRPRSLSNIHSGFVTFVRKIN
ncbi:MAG: methyltransferase domain-containing protein [Candidatus Woesearchaeota archaeon]